MNFDEQPDGDIHGECAAKIARLEIALSAMRRIAQLGWKEAAISWEVCASIHEKWAKNKDAVFTTRQGDFVKHAEAARQKMKELTDDL